MKKWKKCAGLTLVLAVILFLGWNIQISQASSVGATVLTASSTGNLNVRTGANINAAMLKYKGADVKLPNGTQVKITNTVTGTDGKPAWYQITFLHNGVTLSGYASADYVFLNKNQPKATQKPTPNKNSNGSSSAHYKTITKINPVSAPGKTLSNVYVRKSAGGAYYKSSRKKVKLKKKTSVTVKGQKIVKGVVWFKVKFTYKKASRTGYVHSGYVKLTCKSSVSAQIKGVSKSLNTYATLGKKNTLYKLNRKLVTVKKNQSVKIIGDYKVRGVRWYYISFYYNGATRKAYVHARYVTPVPAKSTIKVYAALSSAEFENHMVNQGFPESYKPRLRQLHSAHPYWRFNAYHTSMTWAAAISKESVLGVNLIGSYKSDAWKSRAAGAYNSTTGEYKAFDGNKSNFFYWVAAGTKAIKYYMDPRNFLTETAIFQFELLQYKSEYQAKAGVEAILKTTPFYGKSFQYTEGGKKKTISYVNAFIEAAKKSGVSPFHLTSRMRQEVVSSGTSTTIAVTGNNSKYKGIFNFYNIGATHGTSPALNGLKWASSGTTYLRPWKNRYRSIVGGGIFIGQNYINKGQNTIYLQKYNVTGCKTYVNQYMANVEAAYSEAAKTKNAYAGVMDKQALVFSIPVYKDMPNETSKLPTY